MVRKVRPETPRGHGLQSTSLLRPWDFPGKSTGVGCHRLLLLYKQCMYPIFPSGCEGKLGVALESLQGLRDLT